MEMERIVVLIGYHDTDGAIKTTANLTLTTHNGEIDSEDTEAVKRRMKRLVADQGCNTVQVCLGEGQNLTTSCENEAVRWLLRNI